VGAAGLGTCDTVSMLTPVSRAHRSTAQRSQPRAHTSNKGAVATERKGTARHCRQRPA
jgi:hypothetical protein